MLIAPAEASARLERPTVAGLLKQRHRPRCILGDSGAAQVFQREVLAPTPLATFAGLQVKCPRPSLIDRDTGSVRIGHPKRRARPEVPVVARLLVLVSRLGQSWGRCRARQDDAYHQR